MGGLPPYYRGLISLLLGAGREGISPRGDRASKAEARSRAGSSPAAPRHPWGWVQAADAFLGAYAGLAAGVCLSLTLLLPGVEKATDIALCGLKPAWARGVFVSLTLLLTDDEEAPVLLLGG